jgi:hypothetical protein
VEVQKWPEITLPGLPMAIWKKLKRAAVRFTICVMATFLAAPFGMPGQAAMDQGT